MYDISETPPFTSADLHWAVRNARKCAGTAETFDPFLVFNRDKWKCQLCKISTPKSLRGTLDHRAPELDHIIAIANGGAHAQWNTQCLCKKCNATKKTKTLGQLRLAI